MVRVVSGQSENKWQEHEQEGQRQIVFIFRYFLDMSKLCNLIQAIYYRIPQSVSYFNVKLPCIGSTVTYSRVSFCL